MKTKYAFLTGFAMLAVTVAFAQVEHDDMYFNAKDRVAVNVVKQEVLATQYKQEDLQAAKVSPINPTDSYSGRSVNPEYTNRLKTNPNASNNDSQYFVSGYQPVSVNQNLASNKCGCTSNNLNNPYSSFGTYSMNSLYGLNTGFASPYASFYSPYGMGGYYQPGWTSMMGYTMGGMNAMGGMNFGNSWSNPWSYGYGSSFSNYYGYVSNYYGYGSGMPYGAYGYGYNYYGNPVVVNGGDTRSTTVYGKRSSRSSDTNNLTSHSRSQTSYTRSGQEVSSGRTRSSSSTQSQYYDRAWKSDPTKNTSRSYWSDNGSNTNPNGSRSNWSNSWNNASSGRQSSSSDWGGSRTSGGNSFSGGSTGGASHSGGGHSRGRD